MSDTRSMTTLFLSHGGGPLPLLGDPGHTEMLTTLRALADDMPVPKAILVISAHWEESQPTLTHAANPALVYDYYGFPPESYEITYPAPGSPALAERVAAALEAKGLPARLDDSRGLDHGVFVPLKILYPAANIPVVQLSLVNTLDPALHLRMGEALRALDEEGLLVIGSGFSFHNMRAFFAPATPETAAMNQAFEDWLRETCADPALTDQARRDRLNQWESAPHARYCHPREEHLIPLHVCLGLAGGACRRAESARILNKQASFFLW